MSAPRKGGGVPDARPPRKGYRTCTKCQRNRAERFFAPRGRVCRPCQKKRVSTATRADRIQDTYGIDLDDYDALLEAQGGVCAICGGKRSYNLDIDHCHKTLLIRGLLCKQCNRRILRSVRDNVDILKAAIKYLEDPPAVHTIGKRYTPK